MFKFSERSKSALATCHPDLQKLFAEVIKHVDCTVLEGMRTYTRQEEYVMTGRSKTLKSKHLKQKDGTSHAVDVMIYPINWDDWQRNYVFIGFVKGIAATLGIRVKSGIDWDGDFDIREHSFLDVPHFELITETE